MSGGLPVTSYEVVISTEGQREQVNNYTIKTTSESTSHRLTLDKGIESNKTYQVQLRLTNHIGGSVNAQRLTITTPPKGMMHINTLIHPITNCLYPFL